jgi:NAD(P)-dependent dehydrogenase (short-subunit alcohol dehydrogenase family)
MHDPFDLSGKVAVVTGGSRGLGAEMCRAFAERGASVVVSSRKQVACDALAAEIGGDAIGVAAHVGRWDDCDRLVAAVGERFGRIDVLVNNAGMSPLYPSLPDVTEELFDKVLAVNLRGPFRLATLVGTQMAERDGGAIVNVSSVAAVRPTAGELPYGLAKAGLNALTVGLARTLGPKVRVNTIMPGPFLTDISKAWDMSAFDEHVAPGIPLRRAGEPSEIVGTALYLASEASSYTSGATIAVDGGWSA